MGGKNNQQQGSTVPHTIIKWWSFFHQHLCQLTKRFFLCECYNWYGRNAHISWFLLLLLSMCRPYYYAKAHSHTHKKTHSYYSIVMIQFPFEMVTERRKNRNGAFTHTHTKHRSKTKQNQIEFISIISRALSTTRIAWLSYPRIASAPAHTFSNILIYTINIRAERLRKWKWKSLGQSNRTSFHCIRVFSQWLRIFAIFVLFFLRFALVCSLCSGFFSSDPRERERER